jgi:hypothetical protein
VFSARVAAACSAKAPEALACELKDVPWPAPTTARNRTNDFAVFFENKRVVGVRYNRKTDFIAVIFHQAS